MNKFLCILFLLLISTSLSAQTFTLEGTVREVNGDPLLGVTVIIKETHAGTSTDMKGHFTIKAQVGQTLVVSYVGMKTQHIKVKEEPLHIVLKEEAEVLGGLVITGYQKIQNHVFTGASTSIKMDDIKIEGVADVSRMLEGRVAGLSIQNVTGTFGSAPRINIRGGASIIGNVQPLWVIDGAIYEDLVSLSLDQLVSGDAVTLVSSAIAGLNAADIEDIDFDPKRLDEVNARLDLIYSLEKKYHVESIVELLEQQKEIETQLSLIDNSDDELRQKQLQVEKLHTLCLEKARILTDMRTSSAHKIEKEMLARLVPLGIPNVKFEVQITTKDLSVTGADKVAFMFSANANSPMHPISQVASGGEIARVMLSLKAMISGAVKLPTIIFDEIDTGVSGRVAEKMAQIMQEMGNHDRQVISITHLPQIAALGNSHYKVEKEETTEGTRSHMHELTAEQRVGEIAQMLSGADISDAALQNARELLNLGKK